VSEFHFGGALAGLTFAVAGALFLLDEAGALALDTRLVLPSVLIALGMSAIVGALARRDRTS